MPLLETENIRKEFAPTLAVDNLNFSLDEGQVLGLVGPNGAGKTTLLRMLATVLGPTSGTARLFGLDIRKDYLDIRRRIGFLPDFFNLYSDLTLEECLDFFARAYRVDPDVIPGRIQEVLGYVELEHKKSEFIRHLSRGMVQRMGVAALMMHEPDLLLLDEPASGLDPAARLRLRRTLKKLAGEGRAVIISSHILTELSDLCTHLAIMNRGGIVIDGSVEDIQRKVGKGKIITIEFVGPEDVDKARRLIDELADFDIESADETTITAATSAGRERIAELNTYLASKGAKICGFSEKKADIEELFMEIESGKFAGEESES